MESFLQNKAYFISGVNQVFEKFPTLDTLSFEINNTCTPLIFWVYPSIIINQEKKSWLVHTYEYCKYKNYDESLPKIDDIQKNTYNFEQFLSYLKEDVPYFNNSLFISQLHADLMKKNQSPWFSINRRNLEQNILDFCNDYTYSLYEKIMIELRMKKSGFLFFDKDTICDEEKKPIKI
jgi:hypothetical protein